jgi:hypothetical protein
MKLNPTSNIGHRTSDNDRPVRQSHSKLGVDCSAFDVPRSACHPLSTFNPQPGERGIALVITLILLSVTLFMAVAFLAISRRERGSVVTETDTVTARLAADSALAHAEAQIAATMLQTTNPYSFSLLVSTNYINANGFTAALADPLNVNYDFVAGSGGPLSPLEFIQNVANLWYLPRAPVFAYDRTTGANEFRFYLDLNRNRKFDPNGLVTNVDNGNFVIDNVLGNPVVNNQIGDPEWIGVLERPDAPHGPNNKFLSRYAFVALPAGNTLDLNYIFNKAYNESIGAPDYFRNQGAGSWEINLAAFLADLNTNEWNRTAAPYQYRQPAFANNGPAFQDAFTLLNYRYNYGTLPFAFVLFLNNAAALANGPFDIFPFGPAMTNTVVPFYNYGMNYSWPGADNPNHYFAISSDLFNPAISFQFATNLANSSTNVSTYDRYTFYRLLSQIGTDSAPESDKMNLNYDNLDRNGNVVPNGATNFIAWTPVRFFTNAADRMLRAYTTKWFQSAPSNYLATYYNLHTNYYYTDVSGTIHTNDPTGLGLVNIPFFGVTNTIPSFGVGNIPVYVNGIYVYTPAVQRVLQLAANIYDATTNRYYLPDLALPLPTLFEPVFSKVPNGSSSDVYIFNYVEYTGLGDTLISTPALDLGNPNDLASVQPFSFIYGVPIIVGAKKGVPNFNEFSMESAFQITRKLQLTRASTSAQLSTYKINQMFNCSLSNVFSVECWNSYSTNFARPTTIMVADHILMGLTNDQTTASLWPPLDTYLYARIDSPNWPGAGIGAIMNPGSFLTTNLYAIALPTATYIFSPNYFQPIPANATAVPAFEINPLGLPQPHWGLTATNNLQVVLIDNASRRAIDYVQLRGPVISRDLTAEILAGTNQAVMWETDYVSSGVLPGRLLPRGVEDQLQASEKYVASFWPGQDATTVKAEIDGFLKFLNLTTLYGNTNAFGATNLEIQAAYTPTATPVQITTLQANDPLVHYLASDLFDSASGTTTPATAHERYQPWGKSVQMASRPNVDQTSFNLAFKDPLASSSDHWDFPTTKFPTAGWLGRVHRGTPWQTVYLKASNILREPNGTNTWMNWTGNFNVNDAVNAGPVQDRLLFDVFTTAINDNATRGQLSVNVAANPNDPAAGLAAWSALFSGVIVLSNNISDSAMNSGPSNGAIGRGTPPPVTLPAYTAFPIDPAGANGASSPLGQLVANINSMRTNFVNLDGAQNAFEHVGDILSVSALTEGSPFLHLSNFVNNVWEPDTVQQQKGVSDEMYEWLPQQTMSLLRASNQPRFVIYSYGQTLAPNGVVTSGNQSGMITNYQVVAETVTRSVVHFEGAPTNTHAVVEGFNLLPSD